MDIRHITRGAVVVAVTALLLTFALAVAPKAPAAAPAAFKVVSIVPAFAAEEAAPAEGKAGEAEKEIPHKVGNPSPEQLQDLRRAWDSIPGFDLLLVAILGLGATVGVVGFAAFKQMRV